MRLLALCLWLVAGAAYASPPSPSTVINCVPKVKPGSISQGLGFLWTTIGGLQYDLVTGSYTNYTGAGPVAGPYGSQTLMNSAGVFFGNLPAVTRTDNGSGTGNFSVVALSNAGESSITLGNFLYVGGSTHFEFDANVFGGAVNNGNVSMIVKDGSGNVSQASTPIAVPVFEGNWHTFIFVGNVLSTATWAIYVDGVAETMVVNSSAAVGSINAATAQVGSGVIGSMALAAEYNRALTGAEIATLSLDPMESLLTCN